MIKSTNYRNPKRRMDCRTPSKTVLTTALSTELLPSKILWMAKAWIKGWPIFRWRDSPDSPHLTFDIKAKWRKKIRNVVHHVYLISIESIRCNFKYNFCIQYKNNSLWCVCVKNITIIWHFRKRTKMKLHYIALYYIMLHYIIPWCIIYLIIYYIILPYVM